MPNEFYSGSDYESTSKPDVPVEVHVNYIWPVGAGQNKDEAFEGMHPIVAIGSPTTRPVNMCGVVVTYEAETGRVRLNVAQGAIVKQYVCNISGYTQGAASSWVANLNPGDPVWIDDSVEVGAGCTLSRSSTNSAGQTNPMAGFVMPCQDQLPDVGIGGGRTDPFPIAFATDTDEAWLTVCVMLTPDSY